MADIRPVAGQARQQAPQLLLAQCLAAEVPVGRRPQLLACSAGGQLAVAAAGSQLLLIDISLTAAAQPCSVALLLGCPANITAVALSSSPHEQWAAALAGSAAHFVPASSKGASSPACGISVPSGTEAWQACAWHPSRPVCALLSSQQLQLASPTPANGSSSGSGSSSIYATIGPRSQASNFGATPVAGRCCLAWLDAPGSGSDCWGQLVVSWELHLELLLFGSDWKLLDRRQLLPGVPGVIRRLAAAGFNRLLVTTERPAGQWLSESDQQQQQQEEGQDAAVLLRGLQHAAHRQLPALLLPTAGAGCAGASRVLLELDLAPAAAPAGTADMEAAEAGAVDDAIDLTGSSSSSFVLSAGVAGPAIPSMFMLPPEAPAPQAAHLQPQGGRGPAAQAVEAGQAALLRLHSSDACNGSSSSSGSSNNGGGLRQQGPTSSAAAAGATAVQLEFVPDVAEVHGSLVLLAGGKGLPAVTVCRIGPVDFLAVQQPAAWALPLPAGIPEDCAVRLRGLAVVPLAPAAQGDTEASSDSLLQVWALLAVDAAPLAAAAPFLSAALGGSSAVSRRQQLWLCCYRLPPPDDSTEPPSAVAQHPTVADSAALPPLEAVVQLQQAVRALRQDVTARLDGLDACLAQLLQALRRQD